MAANREIFDAQIVFSGEFLPSLFSPDWFGRNNLIGNEDVEVARGGQSRSEPRSYYIPNGLVYISGVATANRRHIAGAGHSLAKGSGSRHINASA